MVQGIAGRWVRMSIAAVMALACVPLMAAPPLHVIVHGDAVDPGVAYVVLVPRLNVLGRDDDEIHGVITGATPDGQAREYALQLPVGVPTIVRMAPGKYHFSTLVIGPYKWDLSEDESYFEAKAGQLNYPGDWNLQVVRREITMGAQHMGWRIEADIWSGPAALDVAKLDVDPAFTSSLAVAYTKLERPPAHAGVGER